MNQEPAGPTRYFIAKVANVQALKTCVQTGRWACRDRTSPPHPRHVLTEAWNSGDVVIVFSVNNCHGWHGYACMRSEPGSSSTGESRSGHNPQISTSSCSQTGVVHESGGANHISNCDDESGKNSAAELNIEQAKGNGDEQTTVRSFKQQQETDTSKDNDVPGGWHYFNVEWKVSFIQEFGEQCLSSKHTEELYVDEERTLLVNKCRNWQEVPRDVGEILCSQIQGYYTELCHKREEKRKMELEKEPPPFYTDGIGVSAEETWRSIVEQVERDLGKVILACPFGSQRYNLSTPDSDTDMFIVYQARTDELLGFNPPKQTIKNSERESCDYTIHEVYRYCELLLSGDARCVETLFLHSSTVVHGTQEWEKLTAGRKLLLNRECLNKYLRDAQGSKGTKFLQKCCEGLEEAEVLPPKLCKLVYVIVRLLQNARNIVRSEDLQVYREIGSPEREQLMSVRGGKVTLAEAWQIIRQLEQEISEGSVNVPEKTNTTEDFLRTWLLSLRYENFTQHPPGGNPEPPCGYEESVTP